MLTCDKLMTFLDLRVLFLIGFICCYYCLVLVVGVLIDVVAAFFVCMLFGSFFVLIACYFCVCGLVGFAAYLLMIVFVLYLWLCLFAR